MRKIIFSLFIFLLISGVVSAWSDDCERYTLYGGAYTNVYSVSSNNNGYYIFSSISLETDPRESSNSVLKLYSSYGNQAPGIAWSLLTPLCNSSDPNYYSFEIVSSSYSISYNTPITYVKIIRPSDGAEIATCNYSMKNLGNIPTKIDVIKRGSYYDLYANGQLQTSVVNLIPAYSGDVKYCIGTMAQKTSSVSSYTVSTTIFIDDLTDSSIIGTPSSYTEGNNNFIYTWSAQLMRNYQDSIFKISLYSLTNPDNAGFIKSWVVPNEDNSTSEEFGYTVENRSSVMGNYFGLYLLEMTRGSIVLTDTYFYYNQLSNPQRFPEILFLASSDVNSEIRDEVNNGGEITGGGSVYLYPDIKENGIYDITYNIKETPFSLTATLTKIYNYTALNGTNIYFTGLSGQNYFVSIDGIPVNGTNGADTWDYFLTWDQNTHIISFSPDYSIPGVWGYVKNTDTQAAIKSATVTVTNGSFTEYIYTDSNGMYYITKGISEDQYNVTAAKTGYTTSPKFTLTTTAGTTTRKDIFLEKSSGSGIYYAPHDVSFTVLEYWYSSSGLPGVSYAVYDDENETIKTGFSGSKGTFTVKEMDQGINYTITLNHNGNTYTEYIEPGLTEYNLVLNKEGIIHQYYNSWLNLTYSETSNNVTVHYSSSKNITEASLTVTASNGSIVQANTLNTTSGTFIFNFADGDYILQFHIAASDGSTASQAWSISYPSTVSLFPASYPTWLKNTLFVAIIIIFLLAFGKSKNDIACGAVAVLTSFAYYFQWLTCSFNFVVLIWIIALGAIFLHYKRTGAVG